MAQVGSLSPTTGTIVNSSQMESGTGNGDYYRLIPGGSKAGTSAGQWRVGSFFIAGVSQGSPGGSTNNTSFPGTSHPGVSAWGAYNVSESDQFGSLCYFRYASSAFNANLINNTTAVSSGQRWSLQNRTSAPGFPNKVDGNNTNSGWQISGNASNNYNNYSGVTTNGISWNFSSGTNVRIESFNTYDLRGGTPNVVSNYGGFAIGAIIRTQQQSNTTVRSYFFLGGGGRGVTIKDAGSGSSGNPFKVGSNGGNATILFPFFSGSSGAGGNFGGGGGGYTGNIAGIYAPLIAPSSGGAGRVWFTYIRPTATGLGQIPTIVEKGSTYTVELESYWDGVFSGQFTVPLNATSGTQPFYISDSRGARIALFADLAPPPTINSFTAQDQLNLDSNPTDNVTFSWNLTDNYGVAFDVEIYKGSISPSNLLYSGVGQLIGSTTVSTGLQSVAGSNSPASGTFILKVTLSGGDYNEASTTANVYNDNNPSLVVISSTVIPGSLNRTNGSLAPLYTYLILCSLNGVDMPTRVRSLTSGVRIGLNTTSFGVSRIVDVGGIFYIEFTSLDYNTSTTVGGTNAQGEIIGQTNTLTFQIEAGTDIVNVDAVTRAPVIQEAFDFSSSVDTYPYPDIDVVPEEPNTDQFTLSNEINLDDVEVDVEVKSSNPDVQVRINGGGWQDIRQI